MNHMENSLIYVKNQFFVFCTNFSTTFSCTTNFLKLKKISFDLRNVQQYYITGSMYKEPKKLSVLSTYSKF